MSKPKLTYFDAPASRGEECRLALHLNNVEFDDNRVKAADWPALKPTLPFNTVPVLEIDGRVLPQSNAILAYIGRRWGLHPRDLFEAAQHEAMMQHVEDLRHAIGPTLRMKDPERRQAREHIATTTLPNWLINTEKQLDSDGPFFAGKHLHIVDIKLFIMLRWLMSGNLDHIPPDVTKARERLVRLHDAVRDHGGVQSWYAQKH